MYPLLLDKPVKRVHIISQTWFYFVFLEIKALKSKPSYFDLLRSVNESKSVSGNSGSRSSISKFFSSYEAGLLDISAEISRLLYLSSVEERLSFFLQNYNIYQYYSCHYLHFDYKIKHRTHLKVLLLSNF